MKDTENSQVKEGEDKKDRSLESYYEQQSESNVVVPDAAEGKAILIAMDDQHRWLVKNVQISRPYSVSASGVETNTAKLSDESGRGIRDTSGQEYISTREYENNMRKLISFIRQHQP